MSDTPRTDALAKKQVHVAQMEELCRQLELDFAAAQAKLAKFESAEMPEDLDDDLLKQVRALYNKTLVALSCSTVNYPDRINAGLLEIYAYGRRIGAASQKVKNAAKDALLNRAVSLLAEASLTEDGADCDACTELMDDIQKGFERDDKTTDWHYNAKVYDRLCAALGIDNGDEIDVLPLVEKALSETAAQKVRADENERDARRIDWLESQENVVARLPANLSVIEAKFGWTNNPLFEPPRSLREAIDAALAAGKGE